ncbi:MAG: class I adenylate-forming enzyme family protein, partial [Alphaproteobacteria bacterium]
GAGYRAAGLGPGRVVALTQGGPVLHQLVAMLALARIGAVQVVLPLDDPAEVRAAVAARVGVSAVAGERPGRGLDDLPLVPLDRAWLAAGARAPEPVRTPGGDAPWMIVHTSGTTGAPKAAAISHRMEIDRIALLPAFFRYAPGDRLASLVPVAFRVTRSVALKCLSMGGTFIAMPPNLASAAAIDLVERAGVGVLMTTPSQLADLLPSMPEDRPRLPALRVLRTTAGAIPAATVAAVRRRISPNLYVDYGTNDAGSIAVATPADLDRHPDTVGRPFERLQVEVVDPLGRPLPAGIEGEIRLRGPGVTAGYIGDPAATAQAHRRGWFHPGDRGRFSSDGLLFITGRTDEIMNVAGLKVAPAEIEAVLASHAAVAEAAAFALPSDRDQDVPAVAIRLHPVTAADRPTAADLRRFAVERLGPRGPRYLLIVRAIPCDSLGKIQRHRLADMLRTALAARSVRREAVSA